MSSEGRRNDIQIDFIDLKTPECWLEDWTGRMIQV
jgi:hypothetical protein